MQKLSFREGKFVYQNRTHEGYKGRLSAKMRYTDGRVTQFGDGENNLYALPMKKVPHPAELFIYLASTVQTADTQPYIYEKRILLEVKSSIVFFAVCDSAGIRTLDPQLRRLLL